MTTNEILINNENPSFSVLSENLEQNIINGEKTATKKDKEY
jgi:hypothetical protein